MATQGTTSRRHFTEAARAAALIARQRKREQAPPLGTPEVYVVRAPGSHQQFSWEIRRFGGVVIAQGASGGYENARAARSAGRAALIRSGGGA